MGLLLLSAGSVAAAQKDEAPRSRLQPLFDTPLRDTSICKGGDGAWYLTGTPADFQNNDGICLWRSTDCKTWTEIGPVWSIERQSSAWQKQYRVNPDNPTGAEKEKGVRESAGQNRLRGVDESAIRGRFSQPPRPRVLRWRW
jgi:hypothetical protein